MDQYQLSQSGYDVNRKTFQGRFMSMGSGAIEYLKELGIGNDEDYANKYRPLTATINYENLNLRNSWFNGPMSSTTKHSERPSLLKNTLLRNASTPRPSNSGMNNPEYCDDEPTR